MRHDQNVEGVTRISRKRQKIQGVVCRRRRHGPIMCSSPNTYVGRSAFPKFLLTPRRTLEIVTSDLIACFTLADLDFFKPRNGLPFLAKAAVQEILRHTLSKRVAGRKTNDWAAHGSFTSLEYVLDCVARRACKLRYLLPVLRCCGFRRLQPPVWSPTIPFVATRQSAVETSAFWIVYATVQVSCGSQLYMMGQSLYSQIRPRLLSLLLSFTISCIST